MFAFTICLVTSLSAADPDLAVTCKHGGDRIDVSAQADRVVLTVVSPRGIGAAVIQRRQPHWPPTVVLRLVLRGLESLTITAGPVTLEVSVSSSAPHAARSSVAEPDGRCERTIDRTSRYWTEVRVLGADGQAARGLPDEGGYFELPLPPGLLAGNPEAVEIRWIDFYRN